MMSVVRGKAEHPDLIVADKIFARKWAVRSDGMSGTTVCSSPSLTIITCMLSTSHGLPVKPSHNLACRLHKTRLLSNQTISLRDVAWGKPSVASMDGGGMNNVDN